MPNDQKKKKQQADTSNQPGARPVGLSMDDWNKITSAYAKYAQNEAARYVDEAKTMYDQTQALYDRGAVYGQRLYDRLPDFGASLGRFVQTVADWHPSLTNPKFMNKVAFGATKAAPRIIRDR